MNANPNPELSRAELTHDFATNQVHLERGGGCLPTATMGRGVCRSQNQAIQRPELSVTPLNEIIKTVAAFSLTLYLVRIGSGASIVREGGKGNACENVSCEEVNVSQSVHDLVSDSEHHDLAHSVRLL